MHFSFYTKPRQSGRFENVAVRYIRKSSYHDTSPSLSPSKIVDFRKIMHGRARKFWVTHIDRMVEPLNTKHIRKRRILTDGPQQFSCKRPYFEIKTVNTTWVSSQYIEYAIL